jgi:hypothetical protein
MAFSYCSGFFIKASRATLFFSATVVTYYKNTVDLLWIWSYYTIDDTVELVGALSFSFVSQKGCWSMQQNPIALGPVEAEPIRQLWVLPPAGPKTLIFLFFFLICFHTVKRK